MGNELVSNNLDIKMMIYTIRGKQVMLDSDLAKLYGYEVKYLNRQVQRNIERFPSDFMFQLTIDELNSSRCQFGTLDKKGRGSNFKYLPYVFTEQGIYALSGILKGPLATSVSINLIRTFKELKEFYIDNAYLLDRIANIEIEQNKLINFKNESEHKFNQIYDYISEHKEVTQKIFYDGQIYDAFSLFIELVSKAKREIILIDNYVDIKTLNILAKKNMGVNVYIYTSIKGNKLTDTDIKTFNKEYSFLEVNIVNNFHDRFLILDKNEVYLIGQSIKDAGNKCFGVIKIIDEQIIKGIIDKLD